MQSKVDSLIRSSRILGLLERVDVSFPYNLIHACMFAIAWDLRFILDIRFIDKETIVPQETIISQETSQIDEYLSTYTPIWIDMCTLGLAISSITPKPYILQKFLFLWIFCKCIVWFSCYRIHLLSWSQNTCLFLNLWFFNSCNAACS